jgi:hypothetical protein
MPLLREKKGNPNIPQFIPILNAVAGTEYPFTTAIAIPAIDPAPTVATVFVAISFTLSIFLSRNQDRSRNRNPTPALAPKTGHTQKPTPKIFVTSKLDIEMKDLVNFEGEWGMNQIEALIELRYKDFKDMNPSNQDDWEAFTQEWNQMQEYEVFTTKQVKEKLKSLYEEYQEIQIMLEVFLLVTDREWEN